MSERGARARTRARRRRRRDPPRRTGTAGTEPGSPELVSLSEVQAAAQRLRGVVVQTPLLPSDLLSEELGADVRLKCESLQRAGSFKARGANNFVLQLPDDQVGGGVITYSSGNHAQAVALAARTRDVRAVVVMPTTAPRVKVEGAERLGAEVVVEGTTSLERKARAEAIAEAEGLCMVPPFDHPWIIAGQGTVGLEIFEAWEDVDVVLAPIGGGGLLSGVAAALRRLRPDARIVGVEPEGAASMKAALDAGGPVKLDRIETIADGLAPVQAGALTYEHVRDLVDEVVTVDDDSIRSATAFLVVEFSGAASVAALRGGRLGPVEGSKVACVLSGGNLDPSLMSGLG